MNTNKIDLIKAEVVEIVNSINPFIPDEDGNNSEYEAGRFAMATQILQIIDSLEEEPVSEDLEQASKEWLKPQLDKSYANYGEVKMMELTHFDGYAMLDAIEFGAKWQEKKDQSIIELAEDHAMFAGMEKMKEQMMAKAVDATIGLPYENKDGGYTHLVDVSRPLPVGDNKIAIIFKED